MGVCPSVRSQRHVARGLQRAFGKLLRARLQVALAALQPWRSQPGSPIPLPGPSQSLGEKEISTCNGDESHLFLILDDADAPYPEDWVDTAFVPQGNPRGLLGEVPKRSPVSEPGLDARGPEIWKETSRTGKYPQRLSHVLKKIMKEKAAQEADGEPEHRDAFQAGSHRTAHVPPGATEAKHTTGAPVLLKPQEALYNWIRGFFLKNPGEQQSGRSS
ncbi:uncharacterized protein LOC122190672 isoform X2 [Lagopus leucura]|uniref:uncharacterized protein LOC122190672 isoform X2 n=1 Tax=Lagopus leucura TaxID=30410 RepID=UPI001C67DD87|nr:uncharacterized protein LOC122190672 isoform X2 [Lagopus leucura]